MSSTFGDVTNIRNIQAGFAPPASSPLRSEVTMKQDEYYRDWCAWRRLPCPFPVSYNLLLEKYRCADASRQPALRWWSGLQDEDAKLRVRIIRANYDFCELMARKTTGAQRLYSAQFKEPEGFPIILSLKKKRLDTNDSTEQSLMHPTPAENVPHNSDNGAECHGEQGTPIVLTTRVNTSTTPDCQARGTPDDTALLENEDVTEEEMVEPMIVVLTIISILLMCCYHVPDTLAFLL